MIYTFYVFKVLFYFIYFFAMQFKIYDLCLLMSSFIIKTSNFQKQLLLMVSSSIFTNFELAYTLDKINNRSSKLIELPADRIWLRSESVCAFMMPQKCCLGRQLIWDTSTTLNAVSLVPHAYRFQIRDCPLPNSRWFGHKVPLSVKSTASLWTSTFLLYALIRSCQWNGTWALVSVGVCVLSRSGAH